ncbi:MAG: MATE family efflux transporter [Pseudomonadota bacterium]
MSTATTRAEVFPIIKLGVPLMIGLTSATLIGVVDTIMIAPLGTVALAAAGITTAILIILISALWGVVTVVSVRIATDCGGGDHLAVSDHIRNGLALAVLAGGLGALLMLAVFPLLGPMGQPDEVIEILLPYWVSMALWIVPLTVFFVLKSLFDAVGREWTGVGFGYLGVVVNIPANYLLIHVWGWGLLGAGLASLLSQSVALAAGWAFWRLASGMAEFRQPAEIRWSKVRRLLRESLPISIGYAGEGGAYAFLGIMLGWLGATALAAHQVVNAVAGIAYVIPMGLASAVTIRIGMAMGGAAQARLRPILKATILISILWQSATAAVFVLGGGTFAAALSDDPEVVALATSLFIVVALLQVADGVQGTSLGALRGMMDNTRPTVITLLAYWPLALPAAYVFGFVLDFGAVGVWAGYVVGLTVAAIALPWRFWRLTGPGRIGTLQP